MPKKKDKKSGDKQNEQPKTKKKESSAASEAKTLPDDREKDLYLIQIQFLTEQLERFQLKCDELEKQRKDLNSHCSTLEKEKKDITEYLKHSLLEKEDEVDELSERLESLRRAAEEDRDALQLQHSQQQQELQERSDELAEETMKLAVRLADLEEFRCQREELMSNMESLEKQLATQKEEHKAAIHTIEMKTLLDKRRLEEEMESHAAAMAAEVQHLVEQKVPRTTRLAIQENNQVKERYSQLSEQAHVLVEENTALRDMKSQLRLDVDILEEMLREVSRESCVRKRVVEKLTAKCQQLQVRLKDCGQELEQLQIKHKGVLAELEALRQERTSASERCRQDRAAASRLEAELQEERRRTGGMQSIMQEAAVTLRQALMEAATEPDQGVVSWKQLMQKLLVVLDGGTPLGIDPSLSSCSVENNSPDPAAARPPASSPNRAGRLNPALSFQFQLARYRPGDLGLVPRPTVKQKHVFSRTRVGSSSSQPPLHRKPSAQKTTSAVNLDC